MNHPPTKAAAPAEASTATNENTPDLSAEVNFRKPFIPAWLDDAGLSPAEMRVFIHLLRSADNSTGAAWPSYQRMVAITGLSKNTIRRAIESLEEPRRLIRKLGKPFGGSCRYRVLPIVPPESLLNANSSTTGTIEAAPIVPPETRNSPSHGTSIVPPEGQEGSPLKVLQGRFSNDGLFAEESPSKETKKSPKTAKAEKMAMAEEIYSHYPRKESKPAAIKAILKAMGQHPAEYLEERTKVYAAASGWKERQFIPHPATWFNQQRFLDDEDGWKEPQSVQPKPNILTAERLRIL